MLNGVLYLIGGEGRYDVTTEIWATFTGDDWFLVDSGGPWRACPVNAMVTDQQLVVFGDGHAAGGMGDNIYAFGPMP